MNFNYLIIRLSIGEDVNPDRLPTRLEGKSEESAIFRLEFRRNRPIWGCEGGGASFLDAVSLCRNLDCELLYFYFFLKSKVV
jgi:hypothetical protein